MIDMSLSVPMLRHITKCPKCGSTELREYNDPEGNFYECPSCFTNGSKTRICRCGSILTKRRTGHLYDCSNDKCDVSKVRFGVGTDMSLVVSGSSSIGDNK